ncbi:hypothetical protein [Cerasicoccus frondis]|uniref:hypothetical protein n=1 Tax=Cerasicoccus frondis TaxID=490090 RepID=UPI002852578E|nr:hypothetical protein [Cerasicoccus frondis]
MRLSQDLSPRWIFVKAALFAVILLMSSLIVVLDARIWVRAVVIMAVIWSAARIYYFMFYVIEHYVDSSYRFAGIVDCLKYLWRRKQEQKN